jgi:hypothetical protein
VSTTTGVVLASPPAIGAAPASNGAQNMPKRTVSKTRARQLKENAKRKLEVAEAEAGRQAAQLLRQVETQQRIATRTGNRFTLSGNAGLAREAHRLMTNLANTRQARARVEQQSVRQFAAENNLRIAPLRVRFARPRGQQFLEPPVVEIKPAKSRRPASGRPKLRADSSGAAGLSSGAGPSRRRGG